MSDTQQKFLDYGFEDWSRGQEGAHIEFPWDGGDGPAHINVTDGMGHIPEDWEEQTWVNWMRDSAEHMGGNEHQIGIGVEEMTAEEAWILHRSYLPVIEYEMGGTGSTIYELLDGRVISLSGSIVGMQKDMRAFTFWGSEQAEDQFRFNLYPQKITYLDSDDLKRYAAETNFSMDEAVWGSEFISFDDMEVALDQALELGSYTAPEFEPTFGSDGKSGWGLEVDGEKVYLLGYTPHRIWEVIEERGLRPIRKSWVPEFGNTKKNSLKRKLMR